MSFFPGDRMVSYLDVPDPTPGPLDVVVEMKASGMCGSDLQNYRRPLDQPAYMPSLIDRLADRRPRAGRHRLRHRFGRPGGAGAHRPARHGASLSGMYKLQSLPQRLAAALPKAETNGPRLRQQRRWRPCAIFESAGQYAGRASGRAVIRGRRRDFVRHRNRIPTRWFASTCRLATPSRSSDKVRSDYRRRNLLTR